MGLNINEHDVYISKQIRHLRKKLRWSMKTLAYKLNISVQQLQKYETAVNKVSASLLYEIANALEVPVARFYHDPASDDAGIQGNSGFNIVLIEDDINDEAVIRDAIADFPEKTNLYSVQESSKAIDFLRSMHNAPNREGMKPDIVLLELELAKSSGMDILRSIKRDRQLNSTPVVLLTNRSNAKDMTSSYNFNASGLIVKSCSAEELKGQVHHLLSYWTQLVSLPKQLQ